MYILYWCINIGIFTQWNIGQQQDAHEFLLGMLEEIDKRCNTESFTESYSSIYIPFIRVKI